MNKIKNETRGRPSKFRPELCNLAKNYCMLGATNTQLAMFFDVSVSTIDNWISNKADFSNAVNLGKCHADSLVARALHKRATGCMVTKVQVAEKEGKITDIKTYEEEVLPDVTACKFWLMNRQRNMWAGEEKTETVATTLKDLIPDLPDSYGLPCNDYS